MPDWIGYQWLVERYGLRLTQALRTQTRIGPARKSESDGITRLKSVLEPHRPEPTMAGHLAYALKHEGVHLEALSRLFAVIPANELEAWVHSEPTGQYSRRAAFFYETLTRQKLSFIETARATYVNALDPSVELTAAAPVNNARWNVRDNLLGNASFSPQVHLTSETTKALTFDVHEGISRLEGQFGAELVLRSAVWLSIKESRASFAIEHEQDNQDRIRRFARVIEQRTGQSADPISAGELETLQQDILGPKALHYGFRKSPVFVGEAALYGEQRVHYIAPHWDDVPSILSGLREMMVRTAGLSSVARAALLSFGFVYLHPMSDGNGRISRFLINDVLRRDGALPSPYIIPVSAILQKRGFRPMNYDEALEVFSRPFMRRYQAHWTFGPDQKADDGLFYNINFDRYQDGLHSWRYPDLTPHVAFLANALEATIEQEMRGEAQYLQKNSAARARLKEIIEGPDASLDRIIRSVRASSGVISGKLLAEFPILEQRQLADNVVRVIDEEFSWRSSDPVKTDPESSSSVQHS
jgi:Fic/DOC family